MKEIYTIGHSTYSIEKLIDRLQAHNINCLVDVRSTPYSQHAPQYNSPVLKKYLIDIGIIYIFMGKELGARQPDKNLYSKEGYLDFDRFSKTGIFQSGIERIKQGVSKGYKIAIMCTEKDPLDCHRNILVAKALFKQNFIVKNILINGEIELQEKTEQRLLNLYFPNREQMTIFDYINGEQKESELIEQAYKYRNRDIGYKANVTEEGD